MKLFSVLIVTTLLIAACHKRSNPNSYTNTTPPETDTTCGPLMVRTTVPSDATHNDSAWLQLPCHYTTELEQRYPLLIYFNGAFEGSNYGHLDKMKGAGIPEFMADSLRFKFTQNGLEYKFIVICPQSAGGFRSSASTNGIIDYMISHYRVDPSRIYLTGVSSGAYCVLDYITASQAYANRVAAVVPMSTTALDATQVSHFQYVANANVHVRIYCGNQDFEYLQENKSYIDSINTLSPGLGVFTQFSGGHGPWDKEYDFTDNYFSPNMYEWMLQYHK